MLGDMNDSLVLQNGILSNNISNLQADTALLRDMVDNLELEIINSYDHGYTVGYDSAYDTGYPSRSCIGNT